MGLESHKKLDGSFDKPTTSNSAPERDAPVWQPSYVEDEPRSYGVLLDPVGGTDAALAAIQSYVAKLPSVISAPTSLAGDGNIARYMEQAAEFNAVVESLASALGNSSADHRRAASLVRELQVELRFAHTDELGDSFRGHHNVEFVLLIQSPSVAYIHSPVSTWRRSSVFANVRPRKKAETVERAIGLIEEQLGGSVAFTQFVGTSPVFSSGIASIVASERVTARGAREQNTPAMALPLSHAEFMPTPAPPQRRPHPGPTVTTIEPPPRKPKPESKEPDDIELPRIFEEQARDEAEQDIAQQETPRNCKYIYRYVDTEIRDHRDGLLLSTDISRRYYYVVSEKPVDLELPYTKKTATFSRPVSARTVERDLHLLMGEIFFFYDSEAEDWVILSDFLETDLDPEWESFFEEADCDIPKLSEEQKQVIEEQRIEQLKLFLRRNFALRLELFDETTSVLEDGGASLRELLKRAFEGGDEVQEGQSESLDEFFKRDGGLSSIDALFYSLAYHPLYLVFGFTHSTEDGRVIRYRLELDEDPRLMSCDEAGNVTEIDISDGTTWTPRAQNYDPSLSVEESKESLLKYLNFTFFDGYRHAFRLMAPVVGPNANISRVSVDVQVGAARADWRADAMDCE